MQLLRVDVAEHSVTQMCARLTTRQPASEGGSGGSNG